MKEKELIKMLDKLEPEMAVYVVDGILEYADKQGEKYCGVERWAARNLVKIGKMRELPTIRWVPYSLPREILVGDRIRYTHHGRSGWEGILIEMTVDLNGDFAYDILSVRNDATNLIHRIGWEDVEELIDE